MTKFDSRQGENMGNCEENKQEKKKLEDYVRSIPDFPEEGIIFRDVTAFFRMQMGLDWLWIPCRR